MAQSGDAFEATAVSVTSNAEATVNGDSPSPQIVGARAVEEATVRPSPARVYHQQVTLPWPVRKGFRLKAFLIAAMEMWVVFMVNHRSLFC